MIKLKTALTIALFALPIVGTSVLTGCASTTHHESTGQYVDSSAITLKVKAALLANDDVKSLAITVNTYKGGVQLSGYVDNAYQKHKAGEIASRIDGVTVVQNALVIKQN
ncbi:MAG: BON domain-containing protein [Gammaproteobacteria bacterium]|nr:BON domain-containing protein [Gammaproteobacteria bacterium]